MTLDDPSQVSLTPPIEKGSPFDHELIQAESHSPAASRHVPLDYFSPNESQILSPDNGEKSFHDQSGGVSAVDTLIGDDFQFHRFLQDKRDKADAEGINPRQTGVVFKVCHRFTSVFFLNLSSTGFESCRSWSPC